MRTILAFLLDSYREALHSKMFQILAALTAIFLFVLLSIGFETGSLSKGFEATLKTLRLEARDLEVKELSRAGFDTEIEATFVLDSPRVYLSAIGRWRIEPWKLETGELLGTESVGIEGEGDSLRAVIQLRSAREPGRAVRTLVIDGNNANEQVVGALRTRLGREGIRNARVEIVEGDGWRKRIRVTGKTSAFHLSQGGKVSVLFGLWSFEPPFETSVAMVVYVLQWTIFEWGACFVCVVMALIVTAGMLPAFLRRGTIEFWLSKPVGRSRYYLLKFVSGLLFVLPIATAVIGGSFLILSLRSGYWNWWFLASWIVFVLYFAVLHAICMLFGLLTRSTIASILLTALIWSLAWGVFKVRVGIRVFPEDQRPRAVVAVVDGLAVVVPRTAETAALAQYFMAKGMQLDLGSIDIFEEFSLARNVGHSLAYIALVLLISIWIFQRRDF